MHNIERATVTDLLAGARGGDLVQRERLFEACRGYLGMVARAQVESWLQSKVDASDLVQQTLLEAHRDFERFDGGTEAEWLAWLRRIMTHNAADLVRHYRGTNKREIGREVSWVRDDDSHRGAPEPAACDPTPSQQVASRDSELRLAAALNELAPDHREVIVLRNLQRLPFDRVAERMGRSRPAVQMLWARAVKKLQQSLEA
jgi:RNA polymerase sigma-70 factor (ECF subfamily)